MDRTKQPGHPVEAYRDEHFLNAPEARPLRILAEYIQPKANFEKHNIQDTILFFGSARIKSSEDAEAALEEAKRTGADETAARRMVLMSRYYEDSRELARRLTEWSDSLHDRSGRRFVICTGAGPGIMEAANRGAREAGGETVGLGIALPHEEQNNPYVTPELNFEFHYFFTRKFWFLYPAKALVLMPGGFGTLDELFETLTLLQTGKMKKRLPVILYGSEYWDKVLNLDALVEFGSISPEDVNLLHKADTVDDAFAYITEELRHYALPHPGATM